MISMLLYYLKYVYDLLVQLVNTKIVAMVAIFQDGPQ